jgi:hypothetical protein
MLFIRTGFRSIRSSALLRIGLSIQLRQKRTYTYARNGVTQPSPGGRSPRLRGDEDKARAWVLVLTEGREEAEYYDVTQKIEKWLGRESTIEDTQQHIRDVEAEKGDWRKYEKTPAAPGVQGVLNLSMPLGDSEDDLSVLKPIAEKYDNMSNDGHPFHLYLMYSGPRKRVGTTSGATPVVTLSEALPNTAYYRLLEAFETDIAGRSIFENPEVVDMATIVEDNSHAALSSGIQCRRRSS